MDDLLIKRVISDARSRLEKSTLPGSKKKKRTAKELQKFLMQVRSKLERFNIPIPGTEIQMPSDPPKGIAWAVKVAMCNQEKEPEFIEFVRQQGQSDVYLAAIALSSPGEDHGEIRALQAALELLNESAVSIQQSDNAKNPRSPFIALVLDVLINNRNDTCEELWQRLKGCNGKEIVYNKKEIEIGLTFDLEEKPYTTPDKTDKNPLDRRIVYWDTGDRLGSQLRRSFDSMISKLCGEHGLDRRI